MLGLAKRKVVFREGLGAVIVLDKSEEELMADAFEIPDPGYSLSNFNLNEFLSDIISTLPE